MLELKSTLWYVVFGCVWEWEKERVKGMIDENGKSHKLSMVWCINEEKKTSTVSLHNSNVD